MYASENIDVENASFRFDEKTMSSTYELMIKIPGRSFAIDISEKLKLNKVIIEKAKILLPNIVKRFDKIIKIAEENKQETELEKNIVKIRQEIEKIKFNMITFEKQQKVILKEQNEKNK